MFKLTQVSSKKFSLIEILIVVAIIGILASLLLPVLSRARNRAQTTTCLSQMKQVALAVQMYIDDHNDYLPCSNGGNSWDDKLGVMDYDGRGLPESAYNGINAGNPKLYQCPSTKHELNRSNTRYLRSYAMNWGKSNGPNRWRGVISNWQDGWSMKINEINDSGNSIMLMEYHKSDNDLSTGNNSVANNMANINSINDNLRWPHEFHKSNYALVDGSVRFISLQSTYYGLRDATSNDNQLNTMWDCQD